MTTQQLYELSLMLVGAAVGFFAGAPFWCAIATRVLYKYGLSKTDEEF